MLRRKFCSYMFELRKHENITQEKLSEELDCHPQTISRLELGKHIPSKRLFLRLDHFYGGLGISYEEVKYESLLALEWQGHMLLKSIKKGQLPDIERSLSKFKELMDEEKPVSHKEAREYQQFYRLGHLMANRKKGLDNYLFLEELKEIYQIQRPLPDINEMRVLSFNEIEFEMLCMMADTYRRMENNEQAKEMLEALLHNNMCLGNPLIKERYLSVVSVLAKIYYMDNNIDKAKECIGYCFYVLGYITESRFIFENLTNQLELCKKANDVAGQVLINDFLKAFQKLGKYIDNNYNIQRSKNGWLL